ncbi:MAG TPA: alpha/beta fold hydrolase [Polyangiaceae bacterium]
MSRLLDGYAILPGAEAWSAPGHSARARTAVVVVHGFSGDPISMRPLAAGLAERGFRVEMPRLPGHGTSWRDLMRTRYDDWHAEVARAFDAASANSDRTVLVGLSGGGTLSIDLASGERRGAAGVVAINAQILDREGFLMKLAPVIEKLVPAVPSAAAGLSKNDIAKPAVRESAYGWVPTRAGGSFVRALPRIRGQLGNLTAPALIAYSPQDHSVPPENSLYLLRVLGARASALVLERSYHVATLDYDAPLLEQRIAEFCDALNPAR